MSVEISRNLNEDLMSQLCSKYSLDKGIGNYPSKTFGSVPKIDKPHGYSRFYNKHFFEYRNKISSVLEIGVRYGNSLLMWSEYFPAASIYGFDIDTSQIIEEAKNFKVIEGDHFKPEDLSRLLKETQESFDIIVDDGGHEVDAQQIMLAEMFSKVNPGGFYVIEDIHTSLCDKKRYNISDDRKNSTLYVLQVFQKTGKMLSPFIFEETASYLENNIEYCSIFFADTEDFEDPTGRISGSPSITAILKKRK